MNWRQFWGDIISLISSISYTVYTVYWYAQYMNNIIWYTVYHILYISDIISPQNWRQFILLYAFKWFCVKFISSFSNDINHGSRIQFHNVAVWNYLYDVLYFFNWLSGTYTTIHYDNFSKVSFSSTRPKNVPYWTRTRSKPVLDDTDAGPDPVQNQT